MIIQEIDFGPVLGASGVRGFFDEGYWFHKLMKPFGCNFEGCTFVAKTITLDPRVGNMPLKRDGMTPRELRPKCVVVKFRKGVVLNAVGLSGPGAQTFFRGHNRWQYQSKPFMLSFMSVAPIRESRMGELSAFVSLLDNCRSCFFAPFALQINFSCPNVGLDPKHLVEEIRYSLDLTKPLVGIPIIPKYSVDTPPEVVVLVDKHEQCHGHCISNTLPWRKIPEDLKMELFGTLESPLAEFGGGGLSGWPLLNQVCDWVAKAKDLGVKKPINAGGGILHPDDVNLLKDAGADSVFIGSVAILRPWRVQSIIKRAHQVFGS
ncbi:hypothetical protein KJ641_00345 [Patescibacteria group bacterium]|nr:hypothetical protein [Patescibacteria group bacterium]MBU1895308.1 hypothetical protein [Patescibacteria group bacterium]